MQKEGPEMHNPTKSYERKKIEGLNLQFDERYKSSSKRARDQTSNPTSSTNPTPKGRIRRSSKQEVENSHFEEHLIPVATMTDNRTMAEMLRAPTEGCAEAIVVPSILAEQFELKHSLINMMTSEQFFGLEKDNPHDHVRKKLDENGIVSRNKARLVAQAYNQQEDIDYDETYAPVARLESIRILLSYVCALDFKLFHMDVKSAFLNGFINEEGIDFMGPFPSSRGNKYILVAVDYLSKWVEAKALLTNDARVVCKFLKNLFARFGAPKAIISDRGTYFCNNQFTKVMQKYGVTHRLSTPYHPQTSGQVEVANRGLKCILERKVGKNRASWSDKLNDALWAFRAAYKTPIGCTPYKLVYEKACHLPVELEHKAYWAFKHANFDLKTAGDHRKIQINELNELPDQAYENFLIYKEKTKRIHDSKIKKRVFNVGDRVLLFNSRLKIFSGKLKSRCSGPFTISQVFPYGTFELSQPNGPKFKVNCHRIKRYFGEDIPQSLVPNLQTFSSDH
nr:reverse transcriptase domain-containing protein [Tanacetum cinerariifolium]